MGLNNAALVFFFEGAFILKRPMFFIFLTVAVLLFSMPARADVTLDLKINTAKESEVTADSFLRTNIVAYAHDFIPNDIWEKFFKEQRVGDILLDTSGISRDSKDINDIKTKMRDLDHLVLRTISQGGRVQLVFQHGIPRWLSSDPQNEGNLFPGVQSSGEKIWHSSPPADYQKWQEIAYAFVDHFNNDLDTRGKAYYILGSEPENYWVGEEQEFYRYYKHFVLGAREADPNAKVGGINVVGLKQNTFTKYNPETQPNGSVKFSKITTEDKKPIIYNWLKFTESQNLPVNIVAWHDYPAPSPVPAQTANWVVAEKKIRQWLDEFGYSDVELILNDWPEWKPVEHENDSEFQAAYVASSLISMFENGGGVKPLYLGLRDLAAYSKNAKDNASFGGGTGLFTSVGIAKPIYNLYALLGKMQGRLIMTQTGDEYVRGLTSVTDDSIYVLLVNFIPSERIMRYNTYYNIEGKSLDPQMKNNIKHMLESEFKTKDTNIHELSKAIMKSNIDFDTLNLPSHITEKITRLQKTYRESLLRSTQVANVNVSLRNIQGGRQHWVQVEYVIDKNHANSYTIRNEMSAKAKLLSLKDDKKKAHKFINDVNQLTNIDSGRIEKKNVKIQGADYNFNVTLEPNSIHLIVLKSLPD